MHPVDRYYERFVPYLPAAGEIVIFDRSWYSRAGVERVMGFCTEEDVALFFRETPFFEHSLVTHGDYSSRDIIPPAPPPSASSMIHIAARTHINVRRYTRPEDLARSVRRRAGPPPESAARSLVEAVRSCLAANAGGAYRH